ncbi:ABC-2 type transport system ATP-binding protein [Sinosporangium album]|uniref:ABC-2 type transport system ATP-binding protein n=1 Tax=Sinosporangium album TaxID=504805 RepID=A0A1G8DV99_9ACTN|nr:ATP-binding cassette domain-containing protein [Sinosporangium album]SDH61508.1 ABC-2 type transport system ATP-binding protein [Sinosporangium album]
MIKVSRLGKTYGKAGAAVDAVRDLTFAVDPGEIIGLLGPNGAGKTTAMRMLTTLLPPTSGTAVVAGHDLLADPVGVRRRIGYVAQSGATGYGRPLGEELADQAMLYGMSRREALLRAGEVMELLGIADLAPRAGETLSGGQRRRFDLAFGLLHRPSALFLDEPSLGLDPGTRAELWHLVRELREDHGVTVVLSTHYLDEADALCDRLLIVDRGTLVADGSPGELKSRVPGGTATLDEVFRWLTGRKAPKEEPQPKALV